MIGKQCKDLSVEDAASAIFGVTCVNDVTALDLLARDASFAQWTRAKSFDTFGIFGPAIATGLDWKQLAVRTLVNGRERQNYPCSDMIFSPAQIVSSWEVITGFGIILISPTAEDEHPAVVPVTV